MPDEFSIEGYSSLDRCALKTWRSERVLTLRQKKWSWACRCFMADFALICGGIGGEENPVFSKGAAIIRKIYESDSIDFRASESRDVPIFTNGIDPVVSKVRQRVLAYSNRSYRLDNGK